MSKTLYLTDLDGTLLGDDARLSDYAVETLNRLLDAGMAFTCATARSLTSAGPVLERLRLTLPVATHNGALLVDCASGEALHKCLLTPGERALLAGAVEGQGCAPLVYAMLDGRERISWIRGRETAGTAGYLRSHQADRRLRAVEGYGQLFDGEVFYITMIGGAEQMPAMRALRDAMPSLYGHLVRDTYNAEEHWLELYSREATKANAVRRLKALTGADEVVCFGDNLNDLPMFAEGDRSYAVANACAGVRAAATGVIAANTQDGVARWLAANAHI